ncbi:MAG: acyltransferase [Fusobacterium sp. JB019]|nr:acyltransferase [Fusobacterium sp. JB019]
MGENTFINTNTTINCREQVKIGKNCLFGEGVRIYDHDHVFYLSDKLVERNKFKTKSILIGNNCWIGANAIILKGIKIGDNSVIGAGTIVTKDVPKNTIFHSKQNYFFEEKIREDIHD